MGECNNCVGCKHNNAKTHISFDTTTMCVKKRRGTPCMYCYVENSREHGYNAKSFIEHDRYDGWVRRLKKPTIKRLNKMGGLRLFSFGDYLKTHKREIEKLLDDCMYMRLMTKGITKNIGFLKDFHRYPAMGIINLSVDNLTETRNRSPISLKLAKKSKKNYQKVVIRAVALNDVDLVMFGEDPDIDVITLNHGNNGFKRFTKAEVKEAAKQYPGRICCEFETCDGCKSMCGIANLKKLGV